MNSHRVQNLIDRVMSLGKTAPKPEPAYAEISSIVRDRLKGENESFAISAVLALTQEGNKYSPNDVGFLLADARQRPHSPKVIEMIENALVKTLRNGIKEEDAKYLVKNAFEKKSESNALFLLRLLEEIQGKPEVKKSVVEMLARFRGVELGEELLGKIEGALMQSMASMSESDEVKSEIARLFAKGAKGRPQLMVETRKAAEETQVLETEEEQVSARAEPPDRRAVTEAIHDADGMLIELLKSKNNVQKERAAISLALRAGAELAKEGQVRKIRDGLEPYKDEFPRQWEAVLKALGRFLRATEPPGPMRKPEGPGNIAGTGKPVLRR